MNHINKSEYTVCSRCVMDTSDREIVFNEDGVCNHCTDYDTLHKEHVRHGEEGLKELEALIEKIKKAGKDNTYDCVMGISGGVDSTYVAYLAKEYGLRPLLVHLDNGWNSELAVDNIKNIVKKLRFDLETIVLDWEEFKSLQLAYLKASVVDIEMLTDHAIITAMTRTAADNKIKYIINGNNIVTEAILPRSWIYNKGDAANIKDINKQYGSVKLKTFPLLDLVTSKYYKDVLKIEQVSILNYIPYVKSDVKEVISKKLGWRDYGGKHYESVFTRFYQGYILPVKFKIDKRKAHLSTLIGSGQISREEALLELEQPIYDAELLKIDLEFVLKKLELSEEEFAAIMSLPIRQHTDFATNSTVYDQYPLLKIIKPLRQMFKGN